MSSADEGAASGRGCRAPGRSAAVLKRLRRVQPTPGCASGFSDTVSQTWLLPAEWTNSQNALVASPPRPARPPGSCCSGARIWSLPARLGLRGRGCSEPPAPPRFQTAPAGRRRLAARLVGEGGSFPRRALGSLGCCCAAGSLKRRGGARLGRATSELRPVPDPGGGWESPRPEPHAGSAGAGSPWSVPSRKWRRGRIATPHLVTCRAAGPDVTPAGHRLLGGAVDGWSGAPGGSMRRGARLLGFLCLWLPQLRCEGPVQPEQVHLSYPGELWGGDRPSFRCAGRG